ncbi:MAG: hypothetical protein IJ493_04760 [Clostridia bacterium]|nr:hypothetical protein [Clostridia bacterium]
MLKKLYQTMSVLLILCAVVCCVPGCAESEPQQPITAQILVGQVNRLQFLIRSEKGVYREEEADKRRPFDITVEVVWPDAFEEVVIEHTDPMVTLRYLTPEGSITAAHPTDDTILITTLTPEDNTVSYHLDGSSLTTMGSAPFGAYKLLADVSLTANGEEIEFSLELPFSYLAKNAQPGQEEVSAKCTVGDYTFALTSPQRVVEYTAADPQAPFDLTASLVYTGGNESVEIVHGNPLMGAYAIPPEGYPANYGIGFEQIAKRMTLTRNEAVTKTDTGSGVYTMLGELPTGDYAAVGAVSFREDDAVNADIRLSLPIRVK